MLYPQSHHDEIQVHVYYNNIMQDETHHMAYAYIIEASCEGTFLQHHLRLFESFSSKY